MPPVAFTHFSSAPSVVFADVPMNAAGPVSERIAYKSYGSSAARIGGTMSATSASTSTNKVAVRLHMRDSWLRGASPLYGWRAVLRRRTSSASSEYCPDPR